MKRAIADLDMWFVSYDEHAADETFERLNAQAPCKIRRLHGVRGIDNAVRECARLSRTDRFVTIDADNEVRTSLFFQRFDEQETADQLLCFKARHQHNGLEYGAGGVKVWPRHLVATRPTHENARIVGNQLDFCFAYDVRAIDFCASVVECTPTPLQAFRSGYREAVKLASPGGVTQATFEDALELLPEIAVTRLMVWASVGAHHPNGWWAIYGARRAIRDLYVTGVPHTVVNDFLTFNDAFQRIHVNQHPEYAARAEGAFLARDLGFSVPNLDAEASAFMVRMLHNPPHTGESAAPYPPS